jgi:hypothetical protein
MELIVVVSAVGLFGLLVWFLIATSIRTSKMKNQAPTKVRDCREGASVKIVGKIVPIEIMAAPGTSRNCVAYFVYASLGKDSVLKSHVVPFVIDDGTGEAIVDFSDPPIALDLELDHKQSSYLRPIKPEDCPGLDVLGLPRADSLTEGVLEPGERVAVFGEVQILSAPGGKSKVKIVRPAKGPYSVTDKEAMLGS